MQTANDWSKIDILSEPKIVPQGQDITFCRLSHTGNVIFEKHSDGQGSMINLWPSLAPTTRFGRGVYDWFPDGKFFVYLGIDDGVYVYSLSGQRSNLLAQAPANAANLEISPCGKYLTISADATRVYVLSIEQSDQGFRQVNQTGDFAIDPSWSPDGHQLVWHEWDKPNMPWQNSRVMVKNLRTDEPPSVLFDQGCAVGQPKFSPSGGKIGFLSDHDGWLTLWSVANPIKTKKEMPKCLSHAAADHAPPTWGPGLRTWAWVNEDQVAIWRNENASGQLEMRSATSAGTALASGVVHTVSAKNKCIVAVIGKLEQTDRIVVLSGESRRDIATASTESLDRISAPSTMRSWKSGGLDIHARLHPPTANPARKTRLVVWLHEGPTGQTLSHCEPRIAYLRQRGWHILVPDYRGSFGWGRDFRSALYGHWGRADLLDVSRGVEQLIGERWVDPKRVVFYGGSAGGFLTLRLLQERSQLCAAGIALFPVCHLCDTETPPWHYQENYVEQLVGATRRAVSPLESAHKTRRPTLIFHGSEDIIVPAWHSKLFAKAVIDAGGDVKRYEFEGYGHGWSHGPALQDELEQVDRFLDRVVGS